MELCLLHWTDKPEIDFKVSNQPVKSKKSIHALGVNINCKLKWKEQVAKPIKKSNKSICAIRMVQKYFNEQKLTFY
jgi:hypothetical protein